MFFFKQKTAYEMRISDWSSDVCSSDLLIAGNEAFRPDERPALADEGNVGAGAADVDAYEIADAIQRAGVLCADNTGRRPREKQAHRAPFCRFASGYAAARLHDLEAAGDAARLQAVLQIGNIPIDDRFDVGIERRYDGEIGRAHV